MRIKNRPLIFLLVVSFFLTILPLPCLAVDQPPVSLQKAVEIARQKLTIPPSYADFTSRFSDYGNRPAWFLNWRPAGDTGGNFSVSVDANTGEITAMNSYEPGDDKTPAVHIPSVSLEEAAQLSESFLKNIIPGHIGELRLVSPLRQADNTNHLMNDYAIYWQRFVGAIPARGEGAAVRIDKFKGKVVSYELNWTQADFPSAAGAVSAAQAQKAFTDAGMFELRYLGAPDYRPLTRDKSSDPILVYSLSHQSRGLIDALTGNPFVIPAGSYLEGLGIYGDSGMGMASREENVKDQAAAAPLTPEEQEEIRKYSVLLTQQQACEALFKWAPAAKDMSLRSADLEAAYGSPQTRTWNLSFTGKDAEGVNLYLYARLDASSGELTSFYHDYPRDSFDAQKVMSREQSEKAARDFLKRVQPQKSNYIKLNANNEDQNPPSPTRYFDYTRLVNGIPVQRQGMNVTVDSTTGEIVGYDLIWPDQNFPAPAGIIGSSQAVSSYLNQQPLTLSYCALTTEQETKAFRLAYIPWNDANSGIYTMLDARTGKLLDWAGQPLSAPPTAEAFKDLKGVSGEREINILGQLGFFREYGDTFNPNQDITLVSFLRALILARDGDNRVYETGDAQILENAKDRGWLAENLAPGAPLSRETAARIMIRFLNLEQTAGLPGIYINSFKDIAAGSDFTGYAAILKGYKIMVAGGSTFGPSVNVSRAEAAQYVYRLSKVNLR